MEGIRTELEEIKSSHGDVILGLQKKDGEVENKLTNLVIEQFENVETLINRQVGEAMKQSTAMFERGKGENGWSRETDRKKGSKLLSPAETTIPKLDENASQADFIQRVDELYIHLENI